MNRGSVNRIVKKSPASFRDGSLLMASLLLSTICESLSLKYTALARDYLSKGVMNVLARIGKKKMWGADMRERSCEKVSRRL